MSYEFYIMSGIAVFVGCTWLYRKGKGAYMMVRKIRSAFKVVNINPASSLADEQYKKLAVGALYASQQGADQNSIKTGIDYELPQILGEWWGINGVVTGQDLSDNRSPEELIAEAVSLAKECDYVIFFGGLNKSAGQDCEDADRAQLGLPYGQDQLIEALSKVNKNLIVVNISGNAVAMPWVKSVPSIVQAWFLGSEAGSAIASVLLGDVNPSGKLPFTFPVCLEDVGAHKLGEYPGVKRENENIWDAKYNEGIFVGYRWLDKENIKPLFAFGHGLSYTQFEYGKVTLDSKEMTQDGKIVLTVPVTNVGKREGAEIVQLYICDKKSSLSRPEKELKGFCKVKLAAGETKTVSFTIDKSSLSFFDDKQHKWVAEPGKFEAVIAASAEDIKSKTVFELK